MKKFFGFVVAFVMMLGLGVFLGVPNSVANAETEVGEPTQIRQGDFSSLFAGANGAKFVLMEDIHIGQEEAMQNLTGVTLNGNGFCVYTPKPLFNEINNSRIENLKIEASKNFQFDAASAQNFGLLANSVQNSSVVNVFATCEAQQPNQNAGQANLNQEQLVDTFGVLDVTVNGGVKVGGLIGVLSNQSFVKNAYVQLRLNVVQKDENANTTILGGFVGFVDNATILNAYAVPTQSVLVTGEFDTPQTHHQTFVIGGFAGVVGDYAVIKNTFCGGSVKITEMTNKTFEAGEFAGRVTANAQNFEKCYCFNNASLTLLGSNNAAQYDIGFLSEQNFKSLDAFRGAHWTVESEWDTQKTWCKRENFDFPVLQVFQNFSVGIRSGDKVTLKFVTENTAANPGQGERFVPVEGVSILKKYGETIWIDLTIEQEFKPYYALKSLMFVNGGLTFAQFDVKKNIKHAVVPLIVTGEINGTLTAELESIKYHLSVIADGQGVGEVRHLNSPTAIRPDRIFDISQGGIYEFEGVRSSVSYVFHKWVWVGMDGAEVDVMLGNPNKGLFATKSQISLAFGNNAYTSDENAYLFVTEESAGEIQECQDASSVYYTYSPTNKTNITDENTVQVPFEVDNNGVMTFTLMAKFDSNTAELVISVKAGAGASEVYVGGVRLEGIETIDGVNFSTYVILGQVVEVKIKLAEGYMFNEWGVANGSLGEVVGADNVEEIKKATTINIRPTATVVLDANVNVQEKQAVDLTWLWWTLGGVGGASAIALMIILFVKKRQKESFVRYY